MGLCDPGLTGGTGIIRVPKQGFLSIAAPSVVANEAADVAREVVAERYLKQTAVEHVLVSMRALDDPHECRRPGLLAFLARVHAHYDLAVWSATRWWWLEVGVRVGESHGEGARSDPRPHPSLVPPSRRVSSER